MDLPLNTLLNISIKSKSNYSLRSNGELLLSPPVVKTLSTLGDRAFAAAAPKLWNQLPSELRRITLSSIILSEL